MNLATLAKAIPSLRFQAPITRRAKAIPSPRQFIPPPPRANAIPKQDYSALPPLPVFGTYVLRHTASQNYWTGNLSSGQMLTTPHKREATRFIRYRSALGALAADGMAAAPHKQGFAPVPLDHAMQNASEAVAYDALLARWHATGARFLPGPEMADMCLHLARLDLGPPRDAELEPIIGRNWLVRDDSPSPTMADSDYLTPDEFHQAAEAAIVLRSHRYVTGLGDAPLERRPA